MSCQLFSKSVIIICQRLAAKYRNYTDLWKEDKISILVAMLSLLRLQFYDKDGPQQNIKNLSRLKGNKQYSIILI